MSEGYPILKFNPLVRGEHKHCEGPGDIPDGWVDNYENVPEDGPVSEVAAEKPMTKAELTAALTQGGVAFKATDGVAALTALLVDSLQKVLASKEIAFNPDTGPRELLALVLA